MEEKTKGSKSKTESVSVVNEPEQSTVAAVTPGVQPVKPVRRRRTGLKLLFWLLVIGTFGSLFMMFGVYVAQTIVPSAKEWLASHNFIQGDRNGQEKSPFLPQPSGPANTEALTIPQVVKKVSPSVVSIAIVNGNDIPGAAGREADKIGTGFIVDATGIIVTNQHVVRNTTAQYQVVTHDNKTYKPKSIIRDEINDIALIILDAKGIPALSTGDSDQVQVGETVIAIGTPLGEYPGSVTVGVVSGVGRSVTTGNGFWEAQKEYENVLQTDTAINPGNSGGPLLNLFGEVIGVNFATTSGADNISFALPINVVKQKIAEYKQYGKFRSPFLGVNYRMVLAQEAEFYNVQPGALVRSVAKDSPAEKGAVRVGDIITKVNGKTVTSSLAASLSRYKVGDEVTLEIYRSDIQGKSEAISVKVILVDRPATE